MEQSPLYYQKSKKMADISISRNCHCPHYDQCLNKAAYEDLFLDCRECHLRNISVEVFSLDPYK